MESAWMRNVRSIIRKQTQSIVDGTIVDHRLLLKRRDGSEVDAGPIKVKPPGSIVLVAYSNYPPGEEPDLYTTRDGAIWSPGTSEARYQGGTYEHPNSACWTGDRFLVPIYTYDDYSPLLQSRDGGTWAFHPDKTNFQNNGIYGMDATGTGLVVISGEDLGYPPVSSLIISRDFGETWNILPMDSDLYDIWNSVHPWLDSVVLKNDFEWVVIQNSVSDIIPRGHFFYTGDAGGHWTEFEYPLDMWPSTNIAAGLRYFNGYWWMYGEGHGTDEWDTPLIKSADLQTWIPVVTPWSGTYFPAAYLGGPDDLSGTILNLECDPLTNTMIASGHSQYNDSKIMMSDDGGSHWFEVGYLNDDDFRIDHDFDGIYKWPIDWYFDEGGGLAYGYGWWFAVNAAQTPSSTDPPMIRISPSGQISEPVFVAQQQAMDAYILISGGDVTF